MKVKLFFYLNKLFIFLKFFIFLECKGCKIKRNLNFELISTISVTKIVEELVKHGHPSSRKINNKFRVKEQAIKELKEHYNKFHNN